MHIDFTKGCWVPLSIYCVRLGWLADENCTSSTFCAPVLSVIEPVVPQPQALSPWILHTHIYAHTHVCGLPHGSCDQTLRCIWLVGSYGDFHCRCRLQSIKSMCVKSKNSVNYKWVMCEMWKWFEIEVLWVKENRWKRDILLTTTHIVCHVSGRSFM